MSIQCPQSHIRRCKTENIWMMRIDGKKRHFWWLQISNDCNFLPAFFPRFFHCPIGQYHDTLPTINFQSVSTNYPSSSNKPSKQKNTFWDAIWTRYSAFIMNMFLIFKSFIWDMKPAISCLESAGHPIGDTHCLPKALLVLWAAAILSSFLWTLGFEQSG